MRLVPGQEVVEFDGETIVPSRDNDRLQIQLGRVWDVIKDGEWWTLGSISDATGDPTPSISARLRDLRKERFGGHLIQRRYLHDGLWEYRLNDTLVRKKRRLAEIRQMYFEA